jgi:CubicO group peptidase (beta-lactamase class C family)
MFPIQGPEAGGFAPDRLARVSGIARGHVDAGHCAGIAVAVARAGSLALLSVHGHRNLESGLPMTEDTLFRIYSMTKPITTVALMILIEETSVRLTDPVSRFFPEFEQTQVYVSGKTPPFTTEPASRAITIQDLLTHTAGLAYGRGHTHPVEEAMQRDIWERATLDPETTLRDLARLIASHPLINHPGTHWRYSISTDLIGAIVEEVSGQSLADFLKERIFDPLGMSDTFFTVPQDQSDRLAVCYSPGDNGLQPSPDLAGMAFTQSNKHPNGGGGLISTIGDYLLFSQMLLNGGRGQSPDGGRGNSILGPRTVAMMMTNHLPRGVRGWEEIAGYGFGYGLGYGGLVLTDPTQVTSYGSVGQFSFGGAATTSFLVDPGESLAIVIMQQFMPQATYPVTPDVVTSVFQAIAE